MLQRLWKGLKGLGMPVLWTEQRNESEVDTNKDSSAMLWGVFSPCAELSWTKKAASPLLQKKKTL